MMRDIKDLSVFWQAHAQEKLAMCTIISKKDFGYRAIGAKKIISIHGTSCGILSGGCLEGEINTTALENWNQMPFIKSFSTMAETDRFLGYQTGCPGVINILFEELPQNADPFLYLPFGNNIRSEGVAISLPTNEDKRLKRTFSTKSKEENIFFDPWVLPINLTIIGSGPDAPAFAELAEPMGWSIRFLDYRSTFTLPEKYLPLKTEISSLENITSQIQDQGKQAIVLMTHNYEADLEIFRQLTLKNPAYLGCLGPRRRYEQLKNDLLKIHGIEVNSDWEKTVHAPAGLFTSGRSPEEIALSIVSQIQAFLRHDDRK